RRLHRSNPQRREARRPAGLAIHQIRVRPQPANGPSDRHRRAQRAAIARRRGDRMIGRREFITVLGGAAAVWPMAARAQPQSLSVVGPLDLSGTPQGRRQLFAAIRKGLNETGYVEGQNVVIDYLSAEGKIDRLPALVSEFVRRRVAVITAPGNRLAAQAAK